MNEEDSSKPLKILVSGDVEGKLNDLYSKVRTIQSKAGKFDLLFCVGEFFGESDEDNLQIEECLSNPSSIPILTYILGTTKLSRTRYFRDLSGYDLVRDKIIYLGDKGIFTIRHGLNVVYLSGCEDKEGLKRQRKEDLDLILEKPGEEIVKFDSDDIESIISNYERRKKNENDLVDILLTNQWPKFVEKNSNQQIDQNLKSDKFGSELISYLAARVCPRYHFSGLQNVFFERVPYRNHQVLAEKEKHLSRFLALAKANKANKPKFLYAFNLTPAKKMSMRDLAQQSAQSTESPYLGSLSVKNEETVKRKNAAEFEENSTNGGQFFYDQEHIRKMNEISERAMMGKRKKMEAANKEPEPCWFCLGGSKVERHYIVSVGDKCYLAYAKGAINKDHLLIIPIEHIQSTVHADEKLLDEINKFKLALKKYFKSRNKCVLFYERNFRTKHMQIQVFGIKEDKIYLLKDAFMSMAKEQDVDLDEIPRFTNLKQVMRPNQWFYYLELPCEDEENVEEGPEKIVCDRFLCEIRSNNFPINFGRDVVASELILNQAERVEWKECLRPQEEEKQMSTDFRQAFKPFDPTL